MRSQQKQVLKTTIASTPTEHPVSPVKLENLAQPSFANFTTPMAISIRETMLLREVLVTLTNISTATIKTLIDLSNGKDTSTHTVNNEISRLQASVEATTSLIAFYDQKLHQEAEKGWL